MSLISDKNLLIFLNFTKRTHVLAWSKLKAIEDDMLKMPLDGKCLDEIIENDVRKGENAGYQHFLLFPCFQKVYF